MLATVLALLQSLVSPLFGWLQAKDTAAGVKAQAQASTATALGTEVVRGQTSYMQTAMDHWETRAGIAATVGLTVFHYGAVVLDSVFHLGWKIAALPNPMADWEGTVLLAPFALAGALGVIRGVFK